MSDYNEIERTWPKNVRYPATELDYLIVESSGRFRDYFVLSNRAGGNQSFLAEQQISFPKRGRLQIWVHNGVARIVWMEYPYREGQYYQTDIDFNYWDTTQVQMLTERTIVNIINSMVV